MPPDSLNDATAMAQAFASSRTDPVQVLEQALALAEATPHVFISLCPARALSLIHI